MAASFQVRDLVLRFPVTQRNARYSSIVAASSVEKLPLFFIIFRSRTCRLAKAFVYVQVAVDTFCSLAYAKFCDKPESHPQELVLPFEEIEHRNTRAARTNGFVESMNRGRVNASR